MKFLALDTSQLQAAVCVLDGSRVVAGETSQVNVAHSEALLPIVDRVLKSAGLKPDALDAFAVGVGPGSFTGIRIGCATVKGLAQATGKKILGFSSMRALAHSIDATGTAVAMTNAYQGQVFAGWLGEQGWQEDALVATQWLGEQGAALVAKHGKLRLGGSGAKLYWPQLSGELAKLGLAADAIELTQGVDFVSPEGIAREVVRELKNNSSALKPYAQLHANYLRPSAAEIKFGTAVAN